MESITYDDAINLKNTIFIDVRTPLEYSLDHICGAINIPVLSDAQRAIVGKVYKHESQKQAVDAGVAFFSEKLPKIMTRLREHNSKTFIAYCWRGGMRSKAFVSFLRSLGFDMFQLEGGYKDFRKRLKEELYGFEIKPRVTTIYGMTGTGKTEMINKLAPESIDLEGLASHRSSIFGHVGLQPKSQKMFENLLLSELKRVDSMPCVFFEGESRKIGNINLPKNVFEKMITGEPIKVVADIGTRVKRIVGDYFDCADKIQEVGKILESHVLLNKLGAKNVEFMKGCLKSGGYEELVEILLLKYYDPMYKHSQKSLKGAVEIICDDIDEAVRKIREAAK